MNRLDRALGILLLLRSSKTLSASELAHRFEVSTRTIYRDVEALAELGIPVYAEMGRAGGIRLLSGYFLPPVMFTVGEAISLLLGLTALRQLRARPFAAELETAEHKLLAAVPEHLRATLAHTKKIVGFEREPIEVFTLERNQAELEIPTDEITESRTLTTFLQAIFEQHALTLRYRSPYHDSAREYQLAPRGLIWDRDRWYLVAHRLEKGGPPRLFRADRVLAARPSVTSIPREVSFDVMALLNRQWLQEAMAQWIKESPVTIRLSARQTERLKQDWYYGQARFEPAANGEWLMTYGEDNRELVFELIRWLGPEAELLEPESWRVEFLAEVEKMAARYR